MLFIELHALVVFKNILAKYGTKVDLPMYHHLSNFIAFNDHIMLFTLPDAASNTTIVSKELYLHNAVINNVKITTLAPETNCGLKASKELQLFK